MPIERSRAHRPTARRSADGSATADTHRSAPPPRTPCPSTTAAGSYTIAQPAAPSFRQPVDVLRVRRPRSRPSSKPPTDEKALGCRRQRHAALGQPDHGCVAAHCLRGSGSFLADCDGRRSPRPRPACRDRVGCRPVRWRRRRPTNGSLKRRSERATADRSVRLGVHCSGRSRTAAEASLAPWLHATAKPLFSLFRMTRPGRSTPVPLSITTTSTSGL